MKKLTLLATLAFSCGLALQAAAVPCPGPDSFGHECADGGSDCSFLSGAVNNISLGDDTCQTRNIGFSFNFYGIPYTQVGVASNGYVIFGGCGAGDGTDFSNDCPVPSTIDPDNAVFGVWDDLNPGAGGSVRDGNTTVGGENVYVVEFSNVPFFSGGGNTSFQIQLWENSGDGDKAIVSIENSSQADYTTGLESINGTDGISRYCNDGTSGPNCVTFSVEPEEPPTGDCDLRPVLNALDAVEAKLDSNLDARVSSRASQVSVDALEVKMDALQAQVDGLTGSLCEIIRLLHTPQGIRTSSTAECGDFTWNGTGSLDE